MEHDCENSACYQVSPQYCMVDGIADVSVRERPNRGFHQGHSQTEKVLVKSRLRLCISRLLAAETIHTFFQRYVYPLFSSSHSSLSSPSSPSSPFSTASPLFKHVFDGILAVVHPSLYSRYDGTPFVKLCSLIYDDTTSSKSGPNMKQTGCSLIDPRSVRPFYCSGNTLGSANTGKDTDDSTLRKLDSCFTRDVAFIHEGSPSTAMLLSRSSEISMQNLDFSFSVLDDHLGNESVRVPEQITDPWNFFRELEALKRIEEDYKARVKAKTQAGLTVHVKETKSSAKMPKHVSPPAGAAKLPVASDSIGAKIPL
ncbi:uncharacterized protein EV420DRAFT_1636686 [Desarmillaria tabescens]|uniref:Uncharacterized protein n=1 Tax=Armillaria tabescens TaxID=1929756 RepID=A0AA39NI55_ARMTA|nr:uncharacterized protein EV420DRAFT_1636686 [Desarmillaria tabescens]KAK0466081.1 hypothetical protein EV420DRAFT_1636686 [Desarmillaria tabescens]